MHNRENLKLIKNLFVEGINYFVEMNVCGLINNRKLKFNFQKKL